MEANMISIGYVAFEDKEFWFSLDMHLADKEFKITSGNSRLFNYRDESVHLQKIDIT